MESRVREALTDHHVGQRHLDRMVMLSDGVFAIAITLSAIELKPEEDLAATVLQAWGRPLLLYFLSFLLIGSLWFLHRRIVAHLRDVDAVGTVLNLLTLSLVALVPVVVRYALAQSATGEDLHKGFIVYASGVGLTYACAGMMWGYLAFVARLAPDVERNLARVWLLELASAPMLMAAAVCYDIQQQVPALVLTVLALAVLAAKRRYRRLAKAARVAG